MSKQIKPQQKVESEEKKVSKQVHTETEPLQTAVSDPYIPALQRAYANPNTITPNDARVLQRTIGNQAMRRLVIQRKMTVGPVGDKYEQEADTVAKQVVSTLNSPQQDVSQRQEEEEDIQMKPISTVQRQEEDELAQMKPISTVQRQEEDELAQMKPISTLQRQEEDDLAQTKPLSTVQRQEDEEVQMKPLPQISSLQRHANHDEDMQLKSTIQRHDDHELQLQRDPMLDGGTVDTTVEENIHSSIGGGAPLSDQVRHPMEQAFGTNFSGVRIHTGGKSDQINRSISARAFTTGQDIFFRQNEYAPNSSGGKELLAHELTHVVQQNGATHGSAQRNIRRRTDRPTIQREIIKDWKTESSIFMSGRSAKLQDIDAMVVLLNAAIANNDHEKIIAQCKRFDTLHYEWAKSKKKTRNSKGSWEDAKSAKRSPYIEKLKLAVGQRWGASKKALADSTRKEHSLSLKNLRQIIVTHASVPETEAIRLAFVGEEVKRAIQRVKDTYIPYNQRNQDALNLPQAGTLDTLGNLVGRADSKAQATESGATVLEQITTWHQALTNYENYITLDEDMAPYAKRAFEKGMESLQPDSIEDAPLLQGLVGEREEGGGLSDASMEKITEADTDYAAGEKATAEEGGLIDFDEMTEEQIEQLMSEKNKHTGETVYPELQNLLEDNGEDAGEITENKSAGGATITVTYDKSDVNFVGRWTLVERAVERVKAAGFNIPAFKLYMPKYGRKLTASNPGVGHEHTIASSGEIQVAMLVPPNTLQLSSQTYKNPKVATGLSIRMDPKGEGTIVHELGHLLHYMNAPEKSAGLNYATFNGTAPNGVPWASYIAEGISQYGSGNPREFTAEMFVGLVYRNVDINDVNEMATRKENAETTAHIRKFTRNEAFLRMYAALGGPVPNGMAGVFARL